ncbi:MAG: nuclear transport factor 2 family protein [Cyclobacteriaceae bacterium]
MIKSILMTSLLAGIFACTAQKTSDKEAIESAIVKFAKSGDENDSDKLSEVLDNNYRVVMNQLFGTTVTTTVDRATYLGKIESKEWGGDTRRVNVLMIDVNGNNAVAKVEMKGEKLTMTSYFLLVKDVDGEWKLVTDLPKVG